MMRPPCAVVVLVAFALAGCARSTAPVAPMLSEGRMAELSGLLSERGITWTSGFYPLQVGNQWGYARTVAITVLPSEGPAEPPVLTESRRNHRLVCVSEYGGRRYVVEQQRITQDGVSGDQFLLFRQDWSGLYEADLVSNVPPLCVVDLPIASPASATESVTRERSQTIEQSIAAIADPVVRRAAHAAWLDADSRMKRVRETLGMAVSSSSTRAQIGGPLPGELQRLRYPLRAGTRWLIRDDPGLRLPAVVEARETLDLPIGALSAWRIRLLWPDDFGVSVVVWYGSAGYLGLDVLARTPMVGEGDDVIGEVVWDEHERCDMISLKSGRGGSGPFVP